MRRLLFLALFVALVAGVGFSQPTITGLFQYGVMSDFQVTPEQALYGKMIVTEPLDKFTNIVFRFRWKDLNFLPGEAIVTSPTSGGLAASPDWDIDRFYMSTDVTGALGVTGPVTFRLGFGFQDPNGGDLTNGISPFEVADLSGNDIGGNNQATIYPVFTFNKMVNIGAIIAPGRFNKNASQTGQGYEIFVNGGQGPVMAEVGYGNVYKGQTYPNQVTATGAALAPFGAVSLDDPAVAGQQPPLNFMWAAANYKGTSGDIAYAVAVNGQYSLDGDSQGFLLRNHYAAYQDDFSGTSIDTTTYGYGLAGSVVYQGKYTAKLGFVGIEGSPANRLEGQVIAVLDPKVTVDFGIVLNLDSNYTSTPFVVANGSGSGMINDWTVAATINLGLANVRIGWLFMDASAAWSVMSDDIGRLGDANGPSLPSQGAFVETLINF